jgi:hypothetical protein
LPQFFNIRGEFAPQDFDTAILVDCGDWHDRVFETVSWISTRSIFVATTIKFSN